MQFTVQHKLAFALVCLVLLLNLLLFSLVNTSFQRGFLDYINTVQTEQLQSLATALGKAFDSSQELSELRHDPRHWHRLLRDNFTNDGAKTLDSLGLMEDRPPPPPHREHKRHDKPPKGSEPKHPGHPKHHRPPPKGPKVALLNGEEEFVFGRKDKRDQLNLVAINNQAGEVIGYLGLPALKLPQTATDLGFAQQQTRIFAFGAIAISLLSALLAWPLASLLVRPLKRISSSVSQLTAGNYETDSQVNSQDELGLLSRDVNTLARTLKQHEENRQQWAADISHELRTPVNVLKGEIEALQDGVRPTTPAALKSLHEETLRLEKLIGDLHQLAMSDLGALKYKFEPIQLDSLLQDLIEDNDLLTSHKIEADLRVNTPNNSAAKIHGDFNRLQQLFYNLLQNSIRYTDEGGRLEVSLQIVKDPEQSLNNKRKPWLQVIWEDTSPGVEESQLNRLFERLYRVESSRNLASGGSGLGLSICQKIVEAHEGQISASQSKLGGLAIIMTFPLDQSN